MSTIAEALSREGFVTRECAGSKFHSPRPLRVEPVEIAGHPEPIPLCGTCHDNLNTFVFLATASNGTLPWTVRREFGNKIRSLGEAVMRSNEETDD